MPETAHKEPPPVHLQVRLELPDKADKQFTYDFRQSVITMGRDPGNDIQVPLTTVSRQHARIFYELGDYFLEDLGSTHGTDHNGKRIGRGEKRLLRDGDSIRVMSFDITFKTTAGTALDRQPGEKTEQLARRMVQEVLSSLGGAKMDPPALRVMNGPDEGKRYELAEDASEITIGRSPECDLTLDDQNASRRHCLVKRGWNGFTAQDLGSKNGVLVNGKRIEGPQMIKDGDEVQIGGVKLIFIDPPSRLLDQMGGLDNQTMDPEGMAATDGSEDEVAPEEGGYEDPYAEDEGDGGYEPEPEPALDPASELPSMPPDDEDPSGPAPILDPIDPALVSGAKKGVAWDLLILVFGGLFLVGAIALIVLLML